MTRNIFVTYLTNGVFQTIDMVEEQKIRIADTIFTLADGHVTMSFTDNDGHLQKTVLNNISTASPRLSAKLA